MNSIYKIGDSVMLYNGDCIETMRTLPDNSVDSIVTDPPYELGFMNKTWDNTGIANNVEMWKECLRVLKPGGHVLSFGGTRTYHRMACAIEDAGFEIRDQMQWLYGSGFPKSMNISKAVDKALGETSIDIGQSPNWRESKRDREQFGKMEVRGENAERITVPSSAQAKQWSGWGTCLKPAHEPICLARKHISEKTVAENVLKWGTGGLNIDACRIPTNETITNHSRSAESAMSKGKYGDSKEQETHQTTGQSLGRFPANIILDKEAGAILDLQSGVTSKTGFRTEKSKGKFTYTSPLPGSGKTNKKSTEYPGDTGGASRFFYCAKTSKSERNAGLGLQNHHPTVKPVKLMEYLIKLVTPPNGVVLDPFTGSGSTGIAARNLGFRFVGIEKEKEYCEIAEKRISHVHGEKQLSILGDAL